MKMIAFLMKVSLTSLFGKILMEIQFKPKQKENRKFRENLPFFEIYRVNSIEVISNGLVRFQNSVITFKYAFSVLFRTTHQRTFEHISPAL